MMPHSMVDSWLAIVAKLVPLYLLVALGGIAGRRLRVPKEALSRLLIYILVPGVIFPGLLEATLELADFLLPLAVFASASVLCLGSWWISRRIFADRGTQSILSFAAGNANSGYFGIPVALAVFGEAALAPALLINLGFTAYENTTGFFVAARGKHGRWKSLMRVATLPALWAFVLAMLGRSLGFHLPAPMRELALHLRGAYSVLGMMLIGVAIASESRWLWDLKFLSFAFIAKFLAWPAMALAVIAIDRLALNALPLGSHRILLFASSLPMAANTVAIASEFEIEPGKAAVAVLLSTIISLLTVPLILAIT